MTLILLFRLYDVKTSSVASKIVSPDGKIRKIRQKSVFLLQKTAKHDYTIKTYAARLENKPRYRLRLKKYRRNPESPVID